MVEATITAQAGIAANRPHDAVVFEVAAITNSFEVAEAILDFVESERNSKRSSQKVETVSGLYFFLAGALVIWGCARLAAWLFGSMQSTPDSAQIAIGAACGQAILLRLSWHILKVTCIGLTDSLNRATYPTSLHQPTISNRIEDQVRYQRLRLLISETVIRLGKGEKIKLLYQELSRLELTRLAAIAVLVQGWIGMAIKANLPPYGSRLRAFLFASTVVLGTILALYFVRNQPKSTSEVAYLLTWSLLLVLEFLKKRRPTTIYENV